MSPFTSDMLEGSSKSSTRRGAAPCLPASSDARSPHVSEIPRPTLQRPAHSFQILSGAFTPPPQFLHPVYT